MLKKLSIIILISATLIFAADVAVQGALSVYTPAVVGDSNAVVAVLTSENPGGEPVLDIPIFGVIDELITSATLLEEDFETPDEFPPTDWSQVVTNTDTITEEVICTWTQSGFDELNQHGEFAAYCWGSENPSDEWLISPVLNFSAIAEEAFVTLVFNSSFLPFGESPNHFICVSLDGGDTWVDTLTDLSHDNESGERVTIDDPPNPIELDLSDYIGEESVTIGFNYFSDGNAMPTVWSIDDVSVKVENYIERWASGEEVVPAVGGTIRWTHHYFTEPWVPEEEGSYRITVWIELEDDDAENNVFEGIIKAGGGIDLAIGAIVRPKEVETPNESFVPSCDIWNNTEDTCVAFVTCSIVGSGSSYLDTTVTVLDIGRNTVGKFNPFAVGDAGTEYKATFSLIHPLDTVEFNNTAVKDFVAGAAHAIVPVEVLEPPDGEIYDAGTTLTPTVIYENVGVSPENDWYAVMYYCSDLGCERYDTLHITEPMEPGEPTTVTFPEVTLLDVDANYTVNFSCYMNIEDFQGGELEIGFTGIKGAIEDNPMPKEYALAVANSFTNSNPMVRYALPKSGHVAVKLYDVTGKLVETFVEEQVSAGYQSIELNTEDIPSGLYFVHMNADQFSATRKLVLVR